MNILLIGGNGFIGSRLLSSLIRANNKVVIASRNPTPNQIKITPGEALEICLNQFDLIINAAGKYGIKKTKREKNLTLEANIGVCTSISRSINLISKGVINLSSYFEILPEVSPNRNLYYTESKVIGNDILHKACIQYGKYYSRIILFDNYDKDLSRGKLLDQLIQSAKTGEPLSIRSQNTFLNLLDMNQITDAIVKVVESFNTSTPLTGRIDVKNQKTYKISDLISMVEEFSSSKINYIDLNQNLDYEQQKVISENMESRLNFNFRDEVPLYLEKMFEISA